MVYQNTSGLVHSPNAHGTVCTFLKTQSLMDTVPTCPRGPDRIMLEPKGLRWGRLWAVGCQSVGLRRHRCSTWWGHCKATLPVLSASIPVSSLPGCTGNPRVQLPACGHAVPSRQQNLHYPCDTTLEHRASTALQTQKQGAGGWLSKVPRCQGYAHGRW